jgi:hypothetical protein
VKALLSIVSILFLSLLALSGCTSQEEKEPAPEPVKKTVPKAQTVVVIPESVQGMWKAVKISVQDKEKASEEIYTVDIGYAFDLDNSNLRLQVVNFLPHFVMDGKTLTSVGNDTKNPAVQIVITENGTEIFNGWLFSLYPNTHAFQHARYSFSLADFLPAVKKG